MNITRFNTLSRLVLASGLVAASAAAQAGGVQLAVNVDPLQHLGHVAAVVNHVHRSLHLPPLPHLPRPPAVHMPAPVVYAPPPVVVHQRPVYVEQRPVYVEQRPVYVEQRPVYAPQRVIYVHEAPRYGARWGHHHHHRWEREAREEHGYHGGYRGRGDERMIVPRGGWDQRDGDRGDDRGERRAPHGR